MGGPIEIGNIGDYGSDLPGGGNTDPGDGNGGPADNGDSAGSDHCDLPDQSLCDTTWQ